MRQTRSASARQVRLRARQTRSASA